MRTITIIIRMLLYANKKIPPLQHPKQTRKTRPVAATINKAKAKAQQPPLLPALQSLEIRCEGMKLNARDLKSPERRRKGTGKVWRTDTLIKPIILHDIELPRSLSLITNNGSFLPLIPHFPENPEQRKPRRKLPVIPAQRLLLCQESKSLEGKERTAFYLPDNKFAGLHECGNDISIPKASGLLASWGICQLGPQKKKYHVTQLYLGYSFRNLMTEFGKFQQCTARFFLIQLLTTVKELHREGLSHNRLNLDSIFHDCEGRLLVNFFKASSLPLSETELNAYALYFSPQMLLSNGGHPSEKNDIWAIGCIALQFLSPKSIRLSKRHPYNRGVSRQRDRASAVLQKLDRIIEKKPRNGEERFEEETLPLEAIDFIQRCLQMKEENRPTAEQLLEHAFLKQ